MRTYLYILSGIASALMGWSLGHVIISDFQWLEQIPELALFPCVAIFLAIGIVAIDIFLSNPTRIQRNLKTGFIPFTIAAVFGLLIGIASGGIVQLWLHPQLRDNMFNVPDFFVRIIGWVLIGVAVGLGEGLTWRWRSIEAGDSRRYRQRFWTSLIASSLTALVAALIFEKLRQNFGGEIPEALKAWEEPMGFSLLGGLLGLVLSFSTSPSHAIALRAGAGFEYVEPIKSFGPIHPTQPINHPRIEKEKKPPLKFVSDKYAHRIEEGLSIQLPARGRIKIGSGEDVHIFIPGLPKNVAELKLKPGQTVLFPQPEFYDKIEHRGRSLTSPRPIPLKHNDMITFKEEDSNGKKLFRFVYYNRFLDPQG
ncbi:MAG: hypothetical protein SXA11_03205 [Cyanobacteriota bacterium]|nr:hypothetical protein [Cyanobacteriota bacterium]